jgi:transposase
MALTLTPNERTELERRVRSLKIRAEDARRARVILMLADGASYSTIEATVPCYRDYINRWRRRFLATRLEGLRPQYRGQPPTVLTPTVEARILEKTRQAPPDGSTHWSTRKLGRLLGLHHNLVAKTWRRAGLQPHRFERYMASDDPDFETKAADVIGLYVHRIMRSCSRSSRNRIFRPSTASIRCCRCRPVAPSDMASNITGTGRSR